VTLVKLCEETAHTELDTATRRRAKEHSLRCEPICGETGHSRIVQRREGGYIFAASYEARDVVETVTVGQNDSFWLNLNEELAESGRGTKMGVCAMLTPM